MQRDDFTKGLTIVALTGSIGMGKSTTADMFRHAGIPVFDSDAVIHRLQAKDGEAIPLIEAAFPGVVEGGILDRAALGELVFGKPDLLKKLEDIMYPLLHERRRNFFAQALRNGQPVVLVDVPLLFETGGDKAVDKIVVVDAPAAIQRQRVLARSGMTAEKFDHILSRQMPNSEKTARADYVIDTGDGIDSAKKQVEAILSDIQEAIHA